MRHLFAPFLLLFVVGCAGLPVPNTDRQNLATAELTFTALVEQADRMADAGELEGDALLAVQRAAAAGSAALDGAHAALNAGNDAEFGKWFAAVEAAVDEMKRTLQATGDLA